MHLYICTVLIKASGYSVFAVIQTDPQAPLALNRTEADEVASTLAEPTHSSSSPSVPHLSTVRQPTDPTSSSASGSRLGTTTPGAVEGFEDEDMELQAALQASLMGGGGDFSLPLHSGSSSGPQTGVRTPTQRSLPPMAARPPPEPQSLPPLGFQPLGFPPPQQQAYDPADPVAASMARNRVIMDRMRREQEMALREQYEEEVARIHGAGTGAGVDVGASAGTGTRRTRRTRADEEEEAMMRRAIEESQASTGSGSSSLVADDGDEEDDAEVDEEMIIDSDDDDEEYRPQITRIHPPVPAPAHAPALSYPTHRVYDDDDAELQAALKASLESAPEGFTIPDVPPLPVAPPPTSGPSSMSTHASVSSQRGIEDDEVASQASAETTEPEEQLSVDEMRRLRLARFGG